MKLKISLFIFILSGCVTREQIVKDPFGFKTQWQKGSSKTHWHDGEMEIVFPANEFGPTRTGLNWSANIEPRDEYTISYEVKFAENFDFVKGGKLPGLCGGHGIAGERPHADDKWSARIMWRRNGKVVNYVYHADQKGDFGDDFQWVSPEAKTLQFQRNQWQKIKFTVRLNSAGNKDGSITGFFNDKSSFIKTDLKFRNSTSLRIDRLCFDTFFGGRDNSWAPASEQRLFIRSLKVE